MSLRPKRFIGKEITVQFDEPPTLEKSPTCPNAFTLDDQTTKIVETLDQWTDFARKGRFAANMRDEHLSVAQNRGSWGVGRFYFRVRTEDDTLLELYYDRAPKNVHDRKGSWFLRCELEEA